MIETAYFLVIITLIYFTFGNFSIKPVVKTQIFLFINQENNVAGYGFNKIRIIQACKIKGYSGQIVEQMIS